MNQLNESTAHQLNNIYHHTWRKYQAHMKGLQQLRESHLIDDKAYVQLSDQAYESFQERLEREFSPIIKSICAFFLFLFLTIQVHGSDMDMYRQSGSRAARQTVSRTMRSGRSGRKEAA